MLHCEIRLQRRLFTIDVELAVEPGEILCLFGASASGKTSILQAIAGLEPRARTKIAWQQSGAYVDEHTPTWQRGFALVAQQPALFSHMSVKDNILFGVRDSKGYAEALDLAGRFGLHQYLTSRPRQLSGGLAQRVNLVRALAASPRVLLLDEPLSALDGAARRELQDLLRATLRDRQLATILVTHQLSEAQRVGDRLALLDEGRILQTGRVQEVITRPRQVRVARMLGYTSFVPVSESASGSPKARWAIHPDRVVAGAHRDLGPVMSGTVVELTPYQGLYRAAIAVAPGQRLEMTLRAHELPQIGAQIECTPLAPPQIDDTDDGTHSESTSRAHDS